MKEGRGEKIVSNEPMLLSSEYESCEFFPKGILHLDIWKDDYIEESKLLSDKHFKKSCISKCFYSSLFIIQLSVWRVEKSRSNDSNLEFSLGRVRSMT